MSGPFWIDKQALLLLHTKASRGMAGIRDEGLLDSAPARAQNPAACQPDADIAALAAAYAFGLARNHPFADGNKRAALLSIGLFLGVNGWRLLTTPAEATQVILARAASEIEEDPFAAWVRGHVQPL
jgi:death-on-curing protein